ncbi:MFS polyamine transporter [Roridomyces roridus]|uniref:MFS polyamine transporter n=1 Tax=Roridomyces roridus TaxID=1738132 RepID=A0AAD7FK96_9AGAR|nr:MFS polyamine transporter [Roridomyces roridus]
MATTTLARGSSDSDRNLEGLSVKSLDEVDDSELDPRFSARGVARNASDSESTLPSGGLRDNEKIYVEFEDGDPRNPLCFPRSKKWAITLVACWSTLRDLNCTEFQATVGFIVYTLGFGIVPLVTSSFSEEFGRQPLYIVSAIGFMCMYLLIALAKNIQTVIVARFLQGSFGSTWATMVGGTIADLWSPHDRGLPMAIFSVAAVGGSGIGPLVAGWIEANPKLEWRWIEWIQLILCGAYSLFVPTIMRETRSSIILTRLAKKVRKETGDERYRARVEDERASLTKLIYMSCTRPLLLLTTEPVVSAFSLWIGFLWGILFCMLESIPGIFRDLHHFTVGQEGTVYATMIVGTAFGFAGTFYQENLYHKFVDRRGPEARLVMACGASIMLPISMFIYAWCSYPFVPWIALCSYGRPFLVYLAVFSYLADCYGPFASSALAGQSLCRNISATVFPLFTRRMFQAMGYNWANTMFALISLAMVPIPYILFFFGPKIRLRSRFSRMVAEAERKAAEGKQKEKEKV